jgi:hypothetical protein
MSLSKLSIEILHEILYLARPSWTINLHDLKPPVPRGLRRFLELRHLGSKDGHSHNLLFRGAYY